jgi:histone-lysine N-methyltransferase SETD2
MPSLLLPYIQTITDVAADGNCGFRAVASALFGLEEMWRSLRQNVVNDLLRFPMLYSPVYHGVDINQAILRISWEGDGCGPDHYMEAPEDLFVLATVYGCTIVLLNPRIDSNSTILPLRRQGTAAGPTREIFIAHLNDFLHFVRVDCVPNGPMPPINAYWHHYHDEGVARWDELYYERIAAWNSMLPPPPPPDHVVLDD